MGDREQLRERIGQVGRHDVRPSRCIAHVRGDDEECQQQPCRSQHAVDLSAHAQRLAVCLDAVAVGDAISWADAADEITTASTTPDSSKPDKTFGLKTRRQFSRLMTDLSSETH